MLIAAFSPSRAGWSQGLPGVSYCLLVFIGPIKKTCANHLRASLPP
jgi:hypothetical protein